MRSTLIAALAAGLLCTGVAGFAAENPSIQKQDGAGVNRNRPSLVEKSPGRHDKDRSPSKDDRGHGGKGKDDPKPHH